VKNGRVGSITEGTGVKKEWGVKEEHDEYRKKRVK
jgi:hypothetical protein